MSFSDQEKQEHIKSILEGKRRDFDGIEKSIVQKFLEQNRQFQQLQIKIKQLAEELKRGQVLSAELKGGLDSSADILIELEEERRK
jgi:hypothetical protein